MGRWMGEEGDGCVIDLGPNAQTKRCNSNKKISKKKKRKKKKKRTKMKIKRIGRGRGGGGWKRSPLSCPNSRRRKRPFPMR
jgi:hypothetical protein